MARVIPGIDPAYYYYDADDAGWVSPPNFFRLPRHLSDRTVLLSLTVDTGRLCVSSSSVASELSRRAIDHSVQGTEANSVVYSVPGENLISIAADSVGACVERFGRFSNHVY